MNKQLLSFIPAALCGSIALWYVHACWPRVWLVQFPLPATVASLVGWTLLRVAPVVFVGGWVVLGYGVGRIVREVRQ